MREIEVYDVEQGKWLNTSKSGIVSLYTNGGNVSGAQYYDIAGKAYSNVIVFWKSGESCRVIGVKGERAGLLPQLVNELAGRLA